MSPFRTGWGVAQAVLAVPPRPLLGPREPCDPPGVVAGGQRRDGFPHGRVPVSRSRFSRLRRRSATRRFFRSMARRVIRRSPSAQMSQGGRPGHTACPAPAAPSFRQQVLARSDVPGALWEPDGPHEPSLSRLVGRRAPRHLARDRERHGRYVTSGETDKPLLLAAIEAVASIRPREAAAILRDLSDSDDDDDVVDAVLEATAMCEGLSEEDDDREDSEPRH